MFYYANGDRHEGQFHEGKPFGTHVKYCKNGVIEQINFDEGNIVNNDDNDD